MRLLRGVRLADWSRSDVLIIASRSDPSVFLFGWFQQGLLKDIFTCTRLLGESFDLWKHEDNECAPSFLNQVHVVETYLVDQDVAVRAGSLKSSKPDAVMLISTPAPSPVPPVSAQGDLHINTITGETLVFQPCMCGSGLWSASLQKVCYTRVQPSPSSAVHCRSDHQNCSYGEFQRIRLWSGFRNNSVVTIRVNPEECVRQSTVEQFGNVPVPQFREQLAKIITVILRKRIFQVCQKLEERNSLARRVVRASRTRTPGASMRCGAPRVPGRFKGACACRTLASLSTTAMIFLQHGGVNLAGRPASSMAWSRALRAADSASRISPLSFDGDERGRLRQFYEAVASDRSS